MYRGGGVQNQAEKNSKNAFRPVPVQKFTFPEDRKQLIVAICFGLVGRFQTMIVCPDVKQKQAQDCKTHFETVSLPVAEVLSPVARRQLTHREFHFHFLSLNFGASVTYKLGWLLCGRLLLSLSETIC